MPPLFSPRSQQDAVSKISRASSSSHSEEELAPHEGAQEKASIKRVISKAPAKLIITGEHAALYDCPVIAAAANRFATTTIEPLKLRNIQKFTCSISLDDIRSHVTGTVSMFLRVKERLLTSYKKFITGQKTIRQVLRQPKELFEFALGTLLETCYLELKDALDIRVSSTIPVGCGMGSSAATIVSFVKAIIAQFNIQKKCEWVETLVREVERLQHGRSSGVDTYLSLNGGAVMYEMGKDPRPLNADCKLKLASMPLWIINTGRPESTTGECVAYVRASNFGRESHSIWTDFKTVSETLYSTIVTDNMDLFQEYIRLNQQLLMRLGVVPQKVSSFIHRAYDECGSIMKITGSGAVRGDSAGIILGYGPKPSASLLSLYGYPVVEEVSLGLDGAEVASIGV